MTPAASHPLLTATQLAQLLRAARKQRGLTQAEVGARLGLSQNRVSHLEGHADELSVKQLLTWCAVVGLELSLAERPPLSTHTGTAVPVPAPSSGAPDTPPEW
jgi:HTH-type transcriptional regulator/antitoxin HipB